MTGLESPEQPRRPHIFYGWWMVLVASLLMLLSTESIRASMGIWHLPVSYELGWSIAAISGGVAIFSVVALLLGPVVGFLGDHVISIRRIVIAGLIVLAGAFFIFSQTQNLLVFYVATALIGAGSAMSGWILLMTVVCRWFIRHRATAIGLAHMVSSLGPLFLVPLTFYLFTWVTWREAANVLGVVVLVFAVVALAWFRNRPEDMGLLPNGASTALRQTSFSVFQTLRTRSFWFIAVADGLAAVEILRLADFTLDPRDTTVVLVILSLTTLVFLLVGGIVGDRFPKSLALAAFTALQLVAWGALSFSGSLVALYLSAAFLGMSNGGRTPIRVAILADYFGTGSLATILGLFGFFAGLISFILGPLALVLDSLAQIHRRD